MPSKAKPKPAVNGTPEVSDILTLAEAAAYLKVSEEMLRTEAERNAIPAQRLGAEWRFSKASILKWLEETARTGPAKSKAELDARLKEYWAKYPNQETLEEAEVFLKQIYDARKTEKG
jgi:excisionase family DNA binding protein